MRIKRAPKLSRDTIEYGHTQKMRGGERRLEKWGSASTADAETKGK